MHTIKAFIKTHHVSRLIIAFILFWTPIIIFSKVAGEILERQPIQTDLTILGWIHSQATPALDNLFVTITTIGNVEVFLPITLAIIIYFINKRHRLNALIVFFGVGGAAAANLILKLLFHRNRPSIWNPLVVEHGYSFPSGHAMASSALILCIIGIVWRTKWRIPAIVIGGSLIFLIGLSRLYIGVHYPTDVVAGWSVSAVWVAIVFIASRGVSYEYHKHHLSISSTKL